MAVKVLVKDGKLATYGGKVVEVEATGAEVFYIDLAGDYPNYTCPVAMADIKAAYEAGKMLECRCARGQYTNVLPTAVDPSTKSGVWDGKGYRNGAYASSAKPYYGTDSACWCTGAIAVEPSDVIYVKGATLEGTGHARLGAFSGATGGCYFCKEWASLSGMATVTKLGDKYYKIVLDTSYANYANIGYIVFSAQGTGDGVVVTKNEAIE